MECLSKTGVYGLSCSNSFKSPDRDLDGQLVTVLGLGISGRAAIKLALARGANVVGIDNKKGVSFLKKDPTLSSLTETRLLLEFGEYDERHLYNAQRIVVSPGISLRSFNLQALLQEGYHVVSELDFASEKLPKDLQLIAITGTNGKSTVTTFTGQILEQFGIPCFTGGNLGVPLSEAALSFMESPFPESTYQIAVVEVSSYQMEIQARNFRPSVGVVLNLTPDHLERHKTLEDYGMCKCRIFSHMNSSQLAIIPSRDIFLTDIALRAGGNATRAWIGDIPGVQFNATRTRAIVSVPTTLQEAQLDLTTLKAIGTHNAVNAGTAALLALGVDMGLGEEAVQSAIPKLKPLPHRMEIVSLDENNVLWINDSKATNIEATYTGLRGLTQRRAVVLLGGVAKVLDSNGNIGFQKLAHSLKVHRAIITFGASGEQIKNDLKEDGLAIPCIQTENLEEAIKLAKGLAQRGDAVLLSPGCASFDQFTNFEHRGRQFSMFVKKYSRSTRG